MGIREKHLDKTTHQYAALNALLKDIYRQFTPQFHSDAIYKYFQQMDEKEKIIDNREKYKAVIETLTQGNENWKDASTDGSWGYWVQAIFPRKEEEFRGSPAKSENVKVYACFKNTDIKAVFVDSLKYLLQHAEETFAAKISIFRRSDQMCYWLSQKDFRHLEAFFMPYAGDMVRSMPFVAYKGQLGISRDFPGADDSHNSTQAHIIADYLKTVKDVGEVDVEDMYNNYIAKWNADIYDEQDQMHFKSSSALSFVIIMDTLDALLGRTEITDESFLLSGDGEAWRILSKSHCWADVNKNYAVGKKNNVHQ